MRRERLSAGAIGDSIGAEAHRRGAGGVVVMVTGVVSTRSTLRSEIVDAARRMSSDMCVFISLLVEFDRSGEWALDGEPSCAHWVADRADTEVSTAREWLRIGHALAGVEEVAQRFADGRLSYSKVRAVTRLADAENQHELCEIAERFPAGHLPVALAQWLNRHETPDERDTRQRALTKLGWHLESDGMIAGWFRLPPESGGALTSAIEAQIMRAHRGNDAPADASKPHTVSKWPSLPQQRADALLTIVTGGGANLDAELILHVRGDGCSLDDGTPIADSVVERLALEAFIRVLIHDAEGRPINASYRQRHPDTRQKRVVKERDRVCVDCGSTVLLQYDHEPSFEETKHTVVEELKLRCWRCHKARHAKLAAQAKLAASE